MTVVTLESKIVINAWLNPELSELSKVLGGHDYAPSYLALVSLGQAYRIAAVGSTHETHNGVSAKRIFL